MKAFRLRLTRHVSKIWAHAALGSSSMASLGFFNQDLQPSAVRIVMWRCTCRTCMRALQGHPELYRLLVHSTASLE